MRAFFPFLACLGAFAIGCGGIVRDSGADAITLDSTAADTYVPTTCDAAFRTRCPGDPPITPDSMTTCERERTSGACASTYQALLDCGVANARCGADGKTDSAHMNTVCKAQIDAFIACYTKKDGGIGP